MTDSPDPQTPPEPGPVAGPARRDSTTARLDSDGTTARPDSDRAAARPDSDRTTARPDSDRTTARLDSDRATARLDSDGPPLPTLLVPRSALAPTAVVVGDPERARAAASLLEDAARIGANREYVTFVGSRDGVPITVASHGVGAAGANVCFAELLQGGVRTFIRAGTCGAIVEELRGGDLVIATGAVREDGVSDHWVPAGYPAVADRGLTGRLVAAADEAGASPREGLVVTEANFYPGPEPPRWQRYAGLGPLVVEMEMSSLFVMCSLNGARAAGILTVDGNLVETRSADMSDYDPHRDEVREGVGLMLEIAIAAAARTDPSR